MNSVTSRRLVAGMLITGSKWNSTMLAQNTNYSDYYSAQKSAYPRTAIAPNRYLYDTYFHHRATVSPYLSGAVLGGSDAGTAYTTSIRPEIQRREAAARTQANYIQQRTRQDIMGNTANPGARF